MTRRTLGIVIVAAAVLAVAAGLRMFRARLPGGTGPTAPLPGSASTAASADVVGQALAARLQLVAGAPGDPSVAVIRVFNLRARQPAPVGSPAPIVVDFSRVTFALEAEDAAAAGTAGAAVPMQVSRLPQPALQNLDQATTAEMVGIVAAASLPAAGARVRARVVMDGAAVTSNWAVVAVAQASPADQLSARARTQEQRGEFDALLQTADAIVAAAPRDPRGPFYRGIVFEQRGDRVAAIAAYRAALERLTPGLEPPIGIYNRIKRLGG